MALSNPASKLPVEVLGDIFTYALPRILDDDGRNELVSFSMVCSRWRAAAICTPRLWSGVRHVYTGDSNVLCEKVTVWLDRSRGVPRTLSIRLDHHSGKTAPHHKDTTKCKSPSLDIAKLLAKDLSLHHLILECASPKCFRNLLNTIRSNGKAGSKRRAQRWDSAIEVLTFQFWDRWSDPVNPSKSIFNRLPPNLTQFELQLPSHIRAFRYHSYGHKETAPLHIPSNVLKRLTSFSLTCDWKGTHVLDLLKHCVNVETLCLEVDTHNGLRFSEDDLLRHCSRSRLLLPKVHTLCLRNIDPFARVRFLRWFEVPCLVDLEMEFTGQKADLDWGLTDFLVPFLTDYGRREPTLRSLKISRVQVDAQLVEHVLRDMPSMKRLALEDVDFKQCADRDRSSFLNPRLSDPKVQVI